MLDKKKVFCLRIFKDGVIVQECFESFNEAEIVAFEELKQAPNRIKVEIIDSRLNKTIRVYNKNDYVEDINCEGEGKDPSVNNKFTHNKGED